MLEGNEYAANGPRGSRCARRDAQPINQSERNESKSFFWHGWTCTCLLDLWYTRIYLEQFRISLASTISFVVTIHDSQDSRLCTTSHAHCGLIFMVTWQLESEGSRSGSSLSLRNTCLTPRGPESTNTATQSPSHHRGVHRSVSATNSKPSRRASSGKVVHTLELDSGASRFT